MWKIGLQAAVLAEIVRVRLGAGLGAEGGLLDD